MYGSDWGQRKVRTDWIAFGILFVVISSILCLFVHVSVLLYFALLFLSGLIAFFVSNAVLRWIERMVVGVAERNTERRRRATPRRSKGYWHW
jgi:hypothetical protein